MKEKKDALISKTPVSPPAAENKLDRRIQELGMRRDIEGLRALGKGIDMVAEVVKAGRVYVEYQGKIAMLRQQQANIDGEIRKIEAQAHREAQKERKAEVIDSQHRAIQMMISEDIPRVLALFPDLPAEQKKEIALEALRKLPEVRL